MRYSQQYQTRWHDTDADRLLRPSQILVYLQETSNAHLASSGLSLDRLRDEKHLAYILSKLRLSLYRRPHAFETITVETWTSAGRGFSSIRNFQMKCGEEILAEADSTWALLGTDDHRLHRTEETGYCFQDEPPLALSLPERIRFPADLELQTLGQRTIVYSDLDYNMHMNNTRYPDMLCDFIPFCEVGQVRGFAFSYLHEAALGDRITVRNAKRDDCYYFRTLNEQGTVCLEAQIFLKES